MIGSVEGAPKRSANAFGLRVVGTAIVGTVSILPVVEAELDIVRR